MDAVVRDHLSVIIAVTLVGVVTGVLALSFVRNSVASMSVDVFSGCIIVIPCVIMFVCAFIIAATANMIGRQLFVVVLAICLITGAITMLVTSSWMSNPDVAAQLLANSGEGATVVPILRSPIIVLRDIAAFVVVAAVGCIMGAWVGSRIHPMRADDSGKKSKKKKRS